MGNPVAPTEFHISNISEKSAFLGQSVWSLWDLQCLVASDISANNISKIGHRHHSVHIVGMDISSVYNLFTPIIRSEKIWLILWKTLVH